jgi:hypothetical protein
MDSNALPKTELKRQIKRFLSDKDRGISIMLFAELCGISKTTLDDVFTYETEPLSEYIQRRVNKGYADWKAGKVKVMRLGRKKWVEYRREPIPPMMKTSKLVLTNGQFHVKVGLVNRHDYSEPTLDEQMRG